MNSYELEDLLPVISDLTDKYTGKESTSITYEKAKQLMGAIIYCIQEYEGEAKTNQIIGKIKVSATEAYKIGYEKVLQKVDKARLCYNEFIIHFHAYGNDNYKETVEKGISAFFTHYDIRFAPQDTIITMDYPTICPIQNMQGVNAIERYITYISIEQKFFKSISEEYIIRVLMAYQRDYDMQYYNICSIVLRNILGITFARIQGLDMNNRNKIKELEKMILAFEKKQLESKMRQILKQMIIEKFEEEAEMFCYLKYDLKDFCTELKNDAQNHCLERAIPLFVL